MSAHQPAPEQHPACVLPLLFACGIIELQIDDFCFDHLLPAPGPLTSEIESLLLVLAVVEPVELQIGASSWMKNPANL
ncbi:hypothetical protein B0H11DRAFT_2246894 [Mycena galericulata]|nr:hypothetical protein B0H11DRAFT_2246894 [Mycena galericulata]